MKLARGLEKLEFLDINSIKHDPQNAKIHTDRQIKQLARIIETEGFTDPIVIGYLKDDKENAYCVSGNGRVMALKELSKENSSYSKIPVSHLAFNDDAQRKSFALKHNAIQQETGFDKDTLDSILNSIKNENESEFESLKDIELENLSDIIQKVNKDNILNCFDINEDLTEYSLYDENLFKLKDNKEIFFNSSCLYGIPPLKEDMILDSEIDDICAKASQFTQEDKIYLVLYNQFAVNHKYNNAVVGFFLHDHIFESVFNDPISCVRKLTNANIKGILAPNFSIWSDEPIALQIFNWYKTQWTSRFFQENGIKVMPTLNWGDERTYDFCFSGIPSNLNTVICQCRNLNNEIARKRFIKGLIEAKERLNFNLIYIYGGNIESTNKFLKENIPSYINWKPLTSQTEKIAELLKK
jgi:hypothetical protein